MQQLVAQVILPIVLAVIMLAMGLGLSLRHFANVLCQPVVAMVGLGLQLVALPLLALVVLYTFRLDAAGAAGLFLLALCPGGVTSNLFSLLARGNVALSISLTAITSLLIPFTLPLAFAVYLTARGEAASDFSMPVLQMIKPLVVVTLLPVVMGMAIRHCAPSLAKRAGRYVRQAATLAMLAVILLLIATNWPLVTHMASLNGGAVLTLSVLAIGLGWWAAGRMGFDPQDARTLALETGIQNAGTAMMVALTLLAQPALAVVPLMYGLLMNIPAFGFIGLVIWQDTYE